MKHRIKSTYPYTISGCLKRLGVPADYADFYRAFAPRPDRPGSATGYDRWQADPFPEVLASIRIVDRLPHISHPCDGALYTGTLTMVKVWVQQFLAVYNTLPQGYEAQAFAGKLIQSPRHDGYKGKEYRMPMFREPTLEELNRARKTPPFKIGSDKSTSVSDTILIQVAPERRAAV